MSGQFKPVSFDPYRGRRSAWRPPRWLVLLLAGVAIGAVGVVVVQERYLPPRLSSDASTALQASYERAERERLRLKADLETTAKQLDLAQNEKKALTDELGSSRQTVDRLKADIASVVAALPPDPRGGVVEVRAARMTKQGGSLAYDMVLSRERSAGRPLSGVIQLVVTGANARGTETQVTLQPIEVSIASHQSLRGSLPLPEAFNPRQTTINVLDRVGGKQLGMRVMNVQQ